MEREREGWREREGMERERGWRERGDGERERGMERVIQEILTFFFQKQV